MEPLPVEVRPATNAKRWRRGGGGGGVCPPFTPPPPAGTRGAEEECSPWWDLI